MFRKRGILYPKRFIGVNKKSRFDFRKIGNIFIFILNIVLVFGLLYFLYFFYISPRHDIIHIRVVGMQYLPSDEIVHEVTEYLEGNKFFGIKTKNINLFNTDNVIKKIEEKYLFKELEVSKQKPDTIMVTVLERPITYRLIDDRREFLIDNLGYVVNEVVNLQSRPSILSFKNIDSQKDNQPKLVEILKTFDTADQFARIYLELPDSLIKVGDQVLNERSLELIAKILNDKSNGYFDVNLVVIPDISPQFLRLSTTQGYNVLFNINTPYKDQFEAFKTVIDAKVGKSNLGKLDYIDLRLGNNIYFKNKN